jgi:hypothetical protein
MTLQAALHAHGATANYALPLLTYRILMTLCSRRSKPCSRRSKFEFTNVSASPWHGDLCKPPAGHRSGRNFSEFQH